MGPTTLAQVISATTLASSVAAQWHLAPRPVEDSRARQLALLAMVASMISLAQFTLYRFVLGPRLIYTTSDGLTGSLLLDTPADILSGKIVQQIPSNAVSLAFQKATLNDDFLRKVANHCKNLEHLSLEKCAGKIGSPFGEFKALETLRLASLNLEEDFLKGCRHLKEFEFVNLRFFPTSFKFLSADNQIETMTFRNCWNIIPALAKYPENFPHLKTLVIERCWVYCKDLQPLHELFKDLTIYYDHYRDAQAGFQALQRH